MAKKKHNMTFTRPVAIRRLAEIPGLIDKGYMSKHAVASSLGIVARTAQTYLAELGRRGEIHVAGYWARENGGSPIAMWKTGPKPDGFVAQVFGQPTELDREYAKARRARRRAQTNNRWEKEKKVVPPFDPFSDPWHAVFWNVVNYPRMLEK